MKPMTSSLRNQIDMKIKNKIDISDLIKDVCLTGENLSGAIIKSFNRCEEDFNNVNFSKSIIGEVGKVTVFSGNKVTNCNFSGAKFLGKTFFRRCRVSGVNFAETDLGGVEFQYSSLLRCRWCGAIVKVGSLEWLGVEVDNNLFNDWAKAIDSEIIIKRK